MSENLLLIQFQRTEEFLEAKRHVEKNGKDPENWSKSKIHVTIDTRRFKPHELRILPPNSELVLTGGLLVYYDFFPPKSLGEFIVEYIEMYFEVEGDILKKIRILGKIKITLENNPSYPYAGEIINVVYKLIDLLKRWNAGDKSPDVDEEIKYLEDKLRQYSEII